DVIDFEACAETLPCHVWRIADQNRSYQQRNDSIRNVDEEKPAPAIVVSDPPAQRWPDGRRHHHRNAVHGQAHAALVGWKGIHEDGLLAGLQATAASALQNSKEH